MSYLASNTINLMSDAFSFLLFWLKHNLDIDNFDDDKIHHDTLLLHFIFQYHLFFFSFRNKYEI